MDRPELRPDPNAPQVPKQGYAVIHPLKYEPSTSEVDKVRTLGLLADAIQQARIQEISDFQKMYPVSANFGYYHHLVGFMDSLVDRMAKESSVNDASYPNWYTYVEDKIDTFKKAYKISY